MMNISSTNIDVFPISYSRANKNDARILTEQHVVNIAKIATAASNASYVINDTVTSPFQFMLLGYHVELNNLALGELIGDENNTEPHFTSGSIYAKCDFNGDKLENDYNETEGETVSQKYGGIVFSGTNEDGALEILRKVEGSWIVPATSAYTIEGGVV